MPESHTAFQDLSRRIIAKHIISGDICMNKINTFIGALAPLFLISLTRLHHAKPKKA